MALIAAVATTWLLWVGCSAHTVMEQRSESDAAIVRVVLERLSEKSPNGTLVAVDTSGSWLVPLLPTQGSSLGATEALAAGRKRGMVEAPIPLPESHSPVRAVKRETVSAIYSSADGWPRFWQAFPGVGALVDLTLPGYSDDQKEAVVGAYIARGPLDAETYLYVLTRNENEWDITATVRIGPHF